MIQIHIVRLQSYNTDTYSCGHKYRDTLHDFIFAKVDYCLIIQIHIIRLLSYNTDTYYTITVL